MHDVRAPVAERGALPPGIERVNESSAGISNATCGEPGLLVRMGVIPFVGFPRSIGRPEVVGAGAKE